MQLSSRLARFEATVMQRLHSQSLICNQARTIRLLFSVCANVENIIVKGPRSDLFLQTFQRITLDEHRRQQKTARQEQTEIEATLESAVLRMTYQMYALLSAVAIGVFIVEIVLCCERVYF